MVVTLLTSQDEISPLKEEASQNITAMSVTRLTSHAEISPLKEEALLNIFFTVVTLLTSQDERSSLNVAYVEQCPVTNALPVHNLPNKLDMSVTPPVHHALMSP